MFCVVPPEAAVGILVTCVYALGAGAPHNSPGVDIVAAVPDSPDQSSRTLYVSRPRVQFFHALHRRQRRTRFGCPCASFHLHLAAISLPAPPSCFQASRIPLLACCPRGRLRRCSVIVLSALASDGPTRPIS